MKATGFQNPQLFDAITTMHYNEKNQTLVFSGTKEAIEELKKILETLDSEKTLKDTAIQELEESNFLIYKLQYHKKLNKKPGRWNSCR